ncbi:MAG: hypothetical protein RL297_150 [Pseudomonadota bacterium]|jgi:hypothetical protein
MLQKEVFIPTICSAVVAGVSLIFYATLVQTVSTDLAAAFIATTALAAIVQIAFVPQAWIYVFGSHEQSDRRRRFSNSALVEIGGGIAGLVVVVPLAFLSDLGLSVLLAYAALFMGGCTSTQGYVRGQGRWATFALIVTMPSFLRLAIAASAILSNVSYVDTLPQMITVYLLVPEGIRYLLLNIPLTLAAWQSVNLQQLQQTSRQLFRNWLYDIGSATTEVADKYLISLIVSPSLLIVYFFVRKMSSAVTIIVEPYYSSRYRALSLHNNYLTPQSDLIPPLRRGYIIAAIICLVLLAAVKGLSLFSFGKIELIPNILLANIQLFIACLFIDGAIAANRWGRYISILNGSATSLLAARWICFLIFILTVFGLSDLSESMALAIGFLCYALLELAYVARSTQPNKTDIISSH